MRGSNQEAEPDYVIADGSGVVFVAAGTAADVVSAAEQIAERERLMAAEVRRGAPVSHVMGARYETMLEESQ